MTPSSLTTEEANALVGYLAGSVDEFGAPYSLASINLIYATADTRRKHILYRLALAILATAASGSGD